MTKSIHTLVPDINKVINGKSGWDAAVSKQLEKAIGATLTSRLGSPSAGRATVRMSNVGQPCERKLWYSVNKPNTAEELQASTKLKFLYGDLIEDLLLSLAVQAGHDVQGQQDEMRLAGIVGHRDAVIDGMLVDVKSASTYSFQKFKDHKLEDPAEDAFGYLTQLACYLAASQDDPLVTHKNHAAFLAVDKQHGHICLDIYDLRDFMEDVPGLIERRKKAVARRAPPKRPFGDVAFQKSGNRVLPTVPCGYCDHKHECWPGLRTFIHGGRPKHYTVVAREPKVPEITGSSK